MCSVTNSDLLQSLWHQVINSSYKNKSDNLRKFLRSLYAESFKQRNRLGTFFVTRDISGIAIILTKQFLSDLENLYLMKNDSPESNNNESQYIINYLESENGFLMLYGIEFIIEQILNAKENKIDAMESSVLKIILESELGNILATALLSILTDMCLNSAPMIDKNLFDYIMIPEFTFTKYLQVNLNLKQPKKRKKKIQLKKRSKESVPDDDDDDDDDDLLLFRHKPRFSKKNKYLGLSKSSLIKSETEIGELCHSDMEESPVGINFGYINERIGPVHVLITLRIVARLLHHIIPLDPSMHTDAISIYLEVLKSSCRLLNKTDPLMLPFQHQVLKLANELLCNIALTVKIMTMKRTENNTVMTILLGHKVIDRLLQIHKSFNDIHHKLPLLCDINKLIFYIFIVISKHNLMNYSGSCRGIIHLLTCWYTNDGGLITQNALNFETENEETGTIVRNSTISLFSEICSLLSILNEIPNEKSYLNSETSAHHNDQFSYILVSQKKPISSDICCYASICDLLLNNFVYLVQRDSKSKFITGKQEQLYQHIFNSTKSIKFCCTIDLVGYFGKLLTLFINPMPAFVKSIVLKFLQLIIETSLDFYRGHLNNDCQYISRHSIVSILRKIKNVCVPKTIDNIIPRYYYNTAFVDLLNFINWLVRIPDNRMKILIMENVTGLIFNRLITSQVSQPSPYYEMIGSSVFSFLPYLNSPWEMNDLQLSWSVCERFPNLKRNYYKCLTIVLLSTRRPPSVDFNESEMKTRIIEYLIFTTNFELIMKRMDRSSFSLTQSINFLLEDVYIWQCFRILFVYNNEFRRSIFENNGIDCCYVILKEVIEYISTLSGLESESLKRSIFLLFESLICLVIDGNMLKNIYYYEGYSHEIIWGQLESTILKFFPQNETVAQLLIQSLLNCSLRLKWTTENSLYELRRLFLDSVVMISSSTNTVTTDQVYGDFEYDSDSSKQDNDIVYRDDGYEADSSSDLMSDGETESQNMNDHNLYDVDCVKAHVFIDTKNNMEINTNCLKLFVNIVLSFPFDNHRTVDQQALESVYSLIKYVPDKYQKSLISDDFMEKMMYSIERILNANDTSDVQLILLKLLILPDSPQCSSSRLRFLIKLSQKNLSLREEIFKLLVAKTDLIQSLQPEFSLILPVIQSKPVKQFNTLIHELISDKKDEEDVCQFLINTKLTKSNWKGLDLNMDSENSGFSVSMWIQMESGHDYKSKKFTKLYTFQRSQTYSESGTNKKSSNDRFNQDYIHVASLYSKEKNTNLKFYSFQIWCQPSSGTIMIRLYQRISDSTSNDTRSVLTQPTFRSNKDSKLQRLNLFSSTSTIRTDYYDSYIINDLSSRSSFVLVDESTINNLLPINTWNFLTITVSWQSQGSGLITWLLNEDIISQSKLCSRISSIPQATQTLESFIAIGEVKYGDDIRRNESFSLGSIFIFEGQKIQSTSDNLSLMFLSPDWDGGSMILNQCQRESSKILGTIIMRLLIEKQVTVELRERLCERSLNIFEYNWAEKINGLISNHLIGSFCCGNVIKFETNSCYFGDTELAFQTGENQDMSRHSSKSVIEEFESSSTNSLSNHILVKSSIDSAVENLGGISILMFWLAKLVESDDQNNVRWLLKLILLLYRKSVFLAYQNIQENGFSTLLQLFKSFKMTLNFEIIRDLVQYMVYKSPEKSKSVTQSNAKLCRDPHIVEELLIQWKILATSKLLARNSAINMTESQALELDKYLLGHINSLVNEDNIFSVTNCNSLGIVGILTPLLVACQESFEALERPLPPEICDIFMQIITNLIPTPVNLNIIVKLCNTILQLHPVSMKDNDMDNGQYYRHLKTIKLLESVNQLPDQDIEIQIQEKPVIPIRKSREELKRMSKSSIFESMCASLQESKVSEVERKAMQQFYESTLSDSFQANYDETGNREIELSTGSTISQSTNSGPTIIDENDDNSVNGSFDDAFIASTDLVDQPEIPSHNESSRVNIIAGLMTILENIIEVKVSDTVLEKLSKENYYFEFILHLLTHSSSLVRQKSLSLFRIYLYQKKSLVQQTNNQPSVFNHVSHIVYQNPTTKEMVVESMSIVFGQNLSHIILGIDWNDLSLPKEPTDLLKHSESDEKDIEKVNSLCKLYGIVSKSSEYINSNFKSDELINTAANHLGLYYRRSCVLLLSVLENVEMDCLCWCLSLFNWILTNNTLLMQACIKSGLLEWICNLTIKLSKELVPKDDARFVILLDICKSVAVVMAIGSNHSQFVKLIEMCQIIHSSGLKLSKHFTKIGNFGNTDLLVQHVLDIFITTTIKTISLANSNDPAFKILINDNQIEHLTNKLQQSSKQSGQHQQNHHHNHYYIDQSKMLFEKLSETINHSISMIKIIISVINTQQRQNISKYQLELCETLGLNLLEFSVNIISNCLVCNEIPDQYSTFLSCKESIKSHVGDLIVSLTHSAIPFNIRFSAIKCLLKFKNFNRVIRYCLLGNSSGSVCMIININQILNQIHQETDVSESLMKNIHLLLDAVSLDFQSVDLNEDSRNLWMGDCEQKKLIWKDKLKTILTNWNDEADRNFNQVIVTMKNTYNVYRSYARKNLQQEYITNIRNQRAAEFNRRRSWKTLTSDFTQERAIWNNVNKPSQIYRLDPTEGPNRMRCRMVKTTHKLNSKFFITESQCEEMSGSNDNLNFLYESTYQIDKLVFKSPIESQLLKCIEDVRITYPCTWVSQSGNFKGEFFVGSNKVGFLVDNLHNSQNIYDELPNQLKDFGFISWCLNELNWILKRRFKLRDYAFEILMKDGRNCLIAMNSTQERDAIINCIESVLSANANRKPSLVDLQNKWLSGELSNFDYLTKLNTAAGRSYNDIMQYPVFPFILTDYSSPILDIRKESTFRDLSKPISIQKPSLCEKVKFSFAEKAEEYQRQLRLIQMSDDPDDMSIWAVPPYHYSSLYSNSGTVLYYMIRIPPFTQKFIEFQDDEFDRPDRIFHTLESAWELSTSSLSCMKELIPEFFYLPEMFINSQGFNFGERLNGIKVDDVIIPSWCSGNARLFCLIHRAAFESPFVSNQLSHWIDLIFGYKQNGKPALEALNLFHPYTYYKAICPDEITEVIRRHAVEQMIENYGQIPKKLFQNKAHPSRKLNAKSIKLPEFKTSSSIVEKASSELENGKEFNENDEKISKSMLKDRKSLTVLNTVHGLVWGDWVGSPETHQTFINDIHKKKESKTGKLFLLPQAKLKRFLKLIVVPKLSNVLILPTVDEPNLPIIKFSITTNKRRVQVDFVNLVNSFGADFQSETLGSFLVSVGSGQAMVTCMAVSQRSGRVFFGMESGVIEVYHGDMFKYPLIKSFIDNFSKDSRSLLGHTSSITHLIMGESFDVLASCDKDANVAIWDPEKLNLLHYIDWKSTKPELQLKSSKSPNPNMTIDFSNDESLSSKSVSLSDVSAMCFSETLGDLVISRLIKPKITNFQCNSSINLFSINGRFIESVYLSGTVTCMSYTNLTEGRNVNAIAAVTNEGRLTVMSSWNLQIIWKVKIPSLYQPDPLVSVQYTHSATELYVLHESGHVQVLQSNKPDLTSRQYVYFWL